MGGTCYTLCYLLHQYTMLCATNNRMKCFWQVSNFMHTKQPPQNRLQHSTFHDLTAVLPVTLALCTVMLHCPSDRSISKQCATFTFQGQAVQILNQYLSIHNQIVIIIQNKMLWPISGHCQLHNWSLKHKKCISSSICFIDQLWTWQWSEVGRSMLFCTINRIWLCSNVENMVSSQ